MTKVSPIVDDRLCIVYIAQTFALWHDGVARPEWNDYWLQKYGDLRKHEASAVATLRECLQESGCKIIREAARENPALDSDCIAAFGALSARSERIYIDERPSLCRWADRIENQPPDYFPRMCGGLDAFFGIEQDYELRVYLLPSPPKSNCGNGDMFVEKGATTLACSGMPLDDEGVFLVLLHEAAHSIHQRRILDPLVAEILGTPYGQKVSSIFRETPVGTLGGSLSSYIGELVIHSLVPHGALREFCGLPSSEDYWESRLRKARRLLHTSATDWEAVYTAWVTAACAEMLPHGKKYVAEQKQIDQAFIYAALGIFEGIYSRWKC